MTIELKSDNIFPAQLQQYYDFMYCYDSSESSSLSLWPRPISDDIQYSNTSFRVIFLGYASYLAFNSHGKSVSYSRSGGILQLVILNEWIV